MCAHLAVEGSVNAEAVKAIIRAVFGVLGGSAQALFVRLNS